MNLARFSVKRPVTAGIISAALFFVGLFFLMRLPVSLWPQVTFPFITVLVPYPGAAPEQIESKIIKPLESAASGIKGLKKITAQSRTGFGFMIFEFRLSVNDREALESVKERIAGARGELPRDIKDPVVRRVDVGASPVLIYGIETKIGATQARKQLKDTVVQSLQRLEGVNDATVVGLGDDRLELQLGARQLNSRQMSALDVYQMLRQKLAVVPWGQVEGDKVAANVSAVQASDDPEVWMQTALALADGRRVLLANIGQVVKTTDQDGETVEINGVKGLGLVITKRADGNTVTTVAAVKKWLATHPLPDGIRLFPIVDQSSMIKENEHEVWIALIAGGFFAVVIIFLALTDVKSALISATALPVAVVGTFIFFDIMGFSINMITLLALALAIGLLIDDAVVVREAIYSEMEKGFYGAEAAIRGTERVASAVLATTLSIVAVFLPVALMGGMVGQFFREFGLTIVIATLISMWVAFTLDPMLSSKFAGTPSMLKGVFWQNWRHGLERFEIFFEKLGSWAFKRPFQISLATLVVLASGVYLIGLKGVDFLNFEDRGQFVLSIKAKPGTTRIQFQKTVRDAAQRLRGLDGMTDVFAREGGNNAVNTADVRVMFVHKNLRKRGLLELINEARERLKGLEADWLILDPPPFEGAGMQAPVMLTIYGTDLEQLDIEAQKARDRLQAIPGIANARIDTGTFGPALDVVIDRTELAYRGTTAEAVELSGRLALTGLDAGTVGVDNVPFVVRIREEDRHLETLNSLLLIPGSKGLTPLFRLVDQQQTQRATAIDREQRSRAMILWATLDRTRSLDKILDQIKSEVIAGIAPPNTGAIAGDAELFEEMLNNFVIALLGAVFFIFVVLAAQFENLLRPFVIILSLPLATVGAFYALAMTGHGLAMGSIIGMIFVMGLAAKNGILLVDAIGQWESKLPLGEAVSKSVRERCRPIFMTSAAMVAGMIPTAVMQGGGSEFRSPMAIAIIGGVISSTFLTLVVVPAIFGLIGMLRSRRGTDPRGHGLAAPKASLVERSVSSLFWVMVAGSSSLYHDGRAIAGASLVGDPSKASASHGKVLTKVSTNVSPEVHEAYQLLGELPAVFTKQMIHYVDPSGAESLKREALQLSADAATASSRLAFAGGVQVAASRQWAQPGYSQVITLPLPDTLGGPIQTSSVVIPRQKDQVTIGAKIPLYNTQAIVGLDLAKAVLGQKDIQTMALKEQRFLSHGQALLEYTAARSQGQILTRASDLALQRFQVIKARVVAGTLAAIDSTQAEAVYQMSRLDMLKATAREKQLYQSIVRRFNLSGAIPPGLPRFPKIDELDAKNLGSSSPGGQAPYGIKAIEALQQAESVYEESARTQDAAFYPTLGLNLSRSSQWYEGNPIQDPQNMAALELQWTLLDGGTRRRQVAEAQRQKLELAAQRQELSAQFQDIRSSYGDRCSQALEVLKAALSLRQAALKAQKAVQDSWQAGLTTSSEVQKADEQVLQSDLGVLQGLTLLQSIHMEGLMAFGKMESLVQIP